MSRRARFWPASRQRRCARLQPGWRPGRAGVAWVITGAAQGCLRLGLCALAATLAGCWPLGHGPTPQQQFIAALARGNGLEAANIWRAMTPRERLEFARSQGINAPASEQETRQAVLRKLQEKYAGPGAAQAQLPDLAAPKASLLDLPSYTPQAGPNPAP